MNRRHTLKIALLISTVILLGNAVAISRDYQDSWILEGLEIPFVLFALTYTLAFFSEKKVSSLVALALVGRLVFVLVPNLKYAWFQGIYIDQQRQYAMANYVYSNGHIYKESVYGYTPLEHLTFSIFSMILGAPVVDSIKYVPVLLSTLFPLLTYVIINSMRFFRGTGVLKYGLFISSIPVNIQAYMVTGSQYGVVLAFLVLSGLVLLLHKKDRRYWTLVTLLVVALAMAHSITSTFLTIFMSVTYLLTFLFAKVFYSSELRRFLRGMMVLTMALISLIWLMFPAKSALEALVGAIFSMAPKGVTPGNEYVPSRFFELLNANMLEGVKAALVYYGADAFILILSVVGLIILFRTRKELDRVSRLLWLYGGVVILSIPVAVLVKVGTFRILYFAGPVLVVFSSIVLYGCKRRVWIATTIFSLMIVLAPIELYACQPLIASANVIKGTLPKNEPIGYVNTVNSVYQRQMVIFARNRINGRIVADSTTKYQIVALAGYDYSDAHLIEWYYPLDPRQEAPKYDFFLIHLPGRSGSFQEKAELRVPSLILSEIYNSTVVYTNGESFVLGA